MTRLRTHHRALALVLAFSALLELYRLGQNGWANAYYSAADKSMLVSLHNFFFVSSDPGGLVSIDKPPLALWLQATSAAIFGLHPLSLLVPEALCAVAGVAVAYAIVAPRFGVWPAVAAAATLAVFPSLVASARDNNVDALLILLMALACLAGLRAVETGAWRWLAATAVFVGLAFNTKTLAAYLVLPGLAAAWMLCAPGGVRRRLGMLAGAAAVLAAVSLVWVLAVQLTPASQRPYVGGTVDNSELSLSFGHNGLGRVLGQRGAPVQTITVKQAKGSLREAGSISSTGKPGPTRLFDRADGDQGAWLLPFALFALLALGFLVRRRDRRDPRLAFALVLGGWFLLEVLVLSVSSGIVHPYYVSALGPGVATLVGAGAYAFAALGARRRIELLLPVAALAVTLAVQVMLLRREHDYLRWLWPVLGVVIAGAIIVMLLRPRLRGPAIAAGLVALLLVPAIYSATVWQVPVDGTFPVAGPYISDDTESLGIPADAVPGYLSLLRYIRAHQTPRRWDLFTQGSTTAAALILLGGRAAALGGYGTTDPVLEPAALASLVHHHEVRFVALGGGYASRGGNAASTAVARTCRRISPTRWRKPQNTGTPGHPVYAYITGGWFLSLYDCGGDSPALAVAH
jgi:4-amino-4-deoxy-L-arabinose transferase-like glycosyltransferase